MRAEGAGEPEATPGAGIGLPRRHAGLCRGEATDPPERGVAEWGRHAHTVRMKRTNLVLDEQLLEEALRISGERTYSATVNLALRKLVERAKAGRILELAGSGAWEGDLGEMRGEAGGPAGKGKGLAAG